MSLKGTHFKNMGLLMRFILRRDRVRLPVWILSLVGVSVTLALSFPELYPPGPEREILAKTMENPAMTSMLGPGYGLGNYHIGAAMAHQLLLFTAVAVAIMNILLTIRHTRRDEEAGRIEVIRSLPVGMLANAGATFSVLVLANLTLALAMGFSLAALGLEGMDLTGSFLYGAALGVTGIFFAALSVLIAQLTETSRGALGLTFALMGLSYLLRAVGDLGSEILSLVSPLGLVLRTEVYVNNYWWPIFVLLMASSIVIILAFRLNTIRDLEAGFIPAKPGRSEASPLLLSPWGLSLTLQKTMIIGWVVGMFVLGVSYGSIYGEIDAFFQTSDIFQLILPMKEGFSLTDQFTATLLAVMAMIGVIPVLLAVLRLKKEEEEHRLEHILSRAVSRRSVLGSYTCTAFLLSIVVQVASGLGLWMAASAVLAEPMGLTRTLLGSLSYVPSMWIMIGIAVLLIGLAPKITGIVWFYLGYTFFIIYFGGLFQVPQWLGRLTPLGYVPDVPMEQMGFGVTIGSILVAILLVVLGMQGYARRDIQN